MNTLFDYIAEMYGVQDALPEVLARFGYALLVTAFVLVIVRRALEQLPPRSSGSSTTRRAKKSTRR